MLLEEINQDSGAKRIYRELLYMRCLGGGGGVQAETRRKSPR